MCGLTFIYDSETEEQALRARSLNALERLYHRGPDGQGLFSGPGWAMGHRRLSIIDLAGSPQPMWDPKRRNCLAYNGEVYNYKELRSGLEPDWKFSTEGDTEVVLAGLLLQGPEFLTRMEGMWAIALWDSADRSLFLARDRMGKKPLYYDATGPGFACASELPALRDLVEHPWHEDDDSTADYLRYGYCLPGYTAWREVREVLPGHYLHWAPGRGSGDQQSYWQLKPGRFEGTQSEAAARLREALIQAVQRRLVADVEVGAFLSGGVDSSLVCAIVRKELGQPLKSFTIGFADPSYDEREFAQRAAVHFDTDHYAEELAGFSLDDLQNLLLANLGQPFQDSSLLPTALVSRVAAKHVKVALSGDGGDELFSGYQRYQARAILRWYTRLPRGLRGNLERLLRMVPEPDQHHSRSLIKKAHLFCDVTDRIAEESPYVAPVMLHRELRIQLAPDLADRGHPPPNLPETTEPDDVAQMMTADALVYLPQDILTKVDRASMAASLEARAPFLDRAVVELAFSFPRSWHRSGLSGKRMLRRAFDDLLPEWLWSRRKQGFAVPIQEWFRGDIGDSLIQLSHEFPEGPIQHQFLANMLTMHRSGQRDFGYRLWSVYAYLLWRQWQEQSV